MPRKGATKSSKADADAAPVPSEIIRHRTKLTVEDLQLHPVWGQPNAHVGSRDDGILVPCKIGMVLKLSDQKVFYDWVVRTTFTLKNGRIHTGFIRVGRWSDPSHRLEDFHPSICSATGVLPLWLGMHRGDIPKILAFLYTALDVKAGDAFPMKFAADIPLSCGPISGEIKGVGFITKNGREFFA